MVAIYAVWYNWLRIHKTPRVTPAMAAGLSKTVTDWSDIIALMDAESAEARPAAPTRKRPQKFQTDALSSKIVNGSAGIYLVV